MPGKYGPLVQHGSIALEPQNYPDAPNHANFPSAILRPGEIYRHRIEWRFERLKKTIRIDINREVERAARLHCP